MSTIEIVTNVRSRVVGLTRENARRLDDAFSLEVKGAKYSPLYKAHRWDGKRHFFVVATSSFPTGLLERFEVAVTEIEGAPPRVIDLRRSLGPEPDLAALREDALCGVVLRDYQMEAARVFLEKRRGILWAATNAGKTAVVAVVLRCFPTAKILYLVHKKVLLRQAREDLAAFLGWIPEHVGEIGDGSFFPQRVTVAVVNSLYAHRNRPTLLAWLRSVDLVVGDEVHHAKAKMVGTVLRMCDAPWRLGMSGTPFPTPTDRLSVEAHFGPVLYRVRNQELIQKGISAVPTVQIVECGSDPIGAEWKWQTVYRLGVVENATRNAAILGAVERHVAEGRRVLVLVTHVWHGDILSSMLRLKKIRFKFVHGKMPGDVVSAAKEEFEKGEISALVASPIFDEGVSIPAIDVLVIADGGKSLRSVLQKVGRALRRKAGENVATIVDFADDGHPWLARHALQRLEIYEREGFEIVAA